MLMTRYVGGADEDNEARVAVVLDLGETGRGRALGLPTRHHPPLPLGFHNQQIPPPLLTLVAGLDAGKGRAAQEEAGVFLKQRSFRVAGRKPNERAHRHGHLDPLLLLSTPVSLSPLGFLSKRSLSYSGSSGARHNKRGVHPTEKPSVFKHHSFTCHVHFFSVFYGS